MLRLLLLLFFFALTSQQKVQQVFPNSFERKPATDTRTYIYSDPVSLHVIGIGHSSGEAWDYAASHLSQ